MNNRLTTIFGLLAGVAELTARSGVLGDRSIYADGAAALALALLGLFSRGMPERGAPTDPLN